MSPYPFRINLYELPSLGTLFVGLAFAFLLGFAKRPNKAANLFLSLALFVIALKAGGLTPLLLPALGPLLCFYVRQLTFPGRLFQQKDMLHFSLLLVGYWIPAWIILVSVIIYLYLSHRLIEDFYRKLRPVLTDRPRFAFRRLDRMLLLLGLFCLLSMLNDVFFFTIAFALIGMAADAIVKPDSGVELNMPITDRSGAREKSRMLNEAVAANRLYEDAELTLSTLAVKLSIHPHDLSRIINVGLEKNFSDFINEFRVREVARKMQDRAYDHMTLLGIAYDSGFNSQSTFHRVFKNLTGKTPAEYKKELPTYKLSVGYRSATVISTHETTTKWSHEKFNRNIMFKNYLKIAWRNLLSQRLYSLVNVTGLAVGLAVCMLILLYVAHEHSYDRFHQNANRIVKPEGRVTINGGNSFDIDKMSYVSGPLIKQSIPVVEDYMRTAHYFTSVVLVSNPSRPQQKFAEDQLLFADARFFNFFSFKLLQGQSSQVLTKPFSVVISKDMAKKYFGKENPVGKTLTIKTDSAYTYQVTGVAENCPSNSSITYDFVASNSGFVTTKGAKGYLGGQQLGGGLFDVYLLLKQRSDTASLTMGIRSIVTSQNRKAEAALSILPLVDRHLQRTGDDANLKYLAIFPLVALLILALALVNYMSLSTARATLRAKEIGVRKMSGASRKSVALQFYIESAVFVTISFLLGYALCYLFKPLFFNALQLKIDSSFLYSPLALSLLLLILVVTVIASGSYPAVVLSAFKPVVSLKGKMSKQTGGVIIRKIFTTFQFAISVGLIICGIVIDRQLYFFRHTDTGVNRDNVLMIPVGPDFKNYTAFKQDVRSLAGISDVATSRYGMFSFYDGYGIQGKTKDESIGLPSLGVNEDFIRLLGLKWKYPPLPGDKLGTGNKVVLNELAVEKLHLPANPIGEYLKGPVNTSEVAGVIKNFNFTSLEDPIQPLGLWLLPDTAKFWKSQGGCYLFAKIKAHTNLPTLLGTVQNSYKKYDADTPFDYTFMDDAFNAKYKAEDRLASIFSVFTIITIVLAGMGLFGLAAFTIEQRTKEIGIRKILGASISSINGLLSKDFLKLVLLSILIASPIAWYVMYNWLQGFSYRINIQWWMFAGAGLIAVIVAVITISYHAIKAAVVNPVDSLRSE